MQIDTDRPERAKPVGIWIRVSTEDQARGESPEIHEHRARAYAESKGWKVKTVYHLEGVSGKAVSEHPETTRMLDDVQTGQIQALIFSKLARLARNTKELLEFSDVFRSNSADLVSLQESIDTSTPAGRLFYTMIAAMAQWEREEIADRVSASIQARAQMGKRLGGQAPFGYRWDEDRLVLEPTEAPVRKLIHELFAEHRRKKKVATILNEQGYRTRNGKLWSHSSINNLLRDPTAKGLHRSNHTKASGPKRGWELKPEKDWVYTEVEPIVSTELWDMCFGILEEQRKGTTRVARTAVQLFGGLTYCECGHKMYVWTSTPNKYVCQKCRNKIPIEDLEAIYYEQLRGFFLSPEEIEAFLGDANAEIRQKEELLQVLQNDESKLKQEMDRVYQLYVEEQITPDGFGERYKPLEQRLAQVRTQLPALQAELDYLKINILSSDEILYEAKDLYSRWPRLEHEDKRRIVENITDKIVVGDGDVTIHLSYLPVASELAANGANNPHYVHSSQL